MAQPIPVEDPEDPRLDPYRAVRDRDLARRDGRFLVEGEGPLRVLLSPASRFRAESVFLAAPRLPALAPLVAAIPADVPVLVASRAAADVAVGFPIHRGVLACARRGPEADAADLLRPPARLVLALLGLSNHDNVGGLFRNAAAFGADAALLDGRTCDPLYRKAIRVSAGAALTVPFARAGDADATVDALAAAGFEVLALSPAGREPLAGLRWPERAALLVGAEGPGLPRAVLDRARSVRIDMAPGVDSLNVATAGGIALAAAFAARPLRPGPDPAGD